jgi:ssDNA-binding Zn-finger/Zn-ribbon topoisomerase 1
MNKNCAVIICPPYPEYKEALKDQSASELFECPKCNEKMWLSQKKKGVIMFAACLNRDILLACYDCIKNRAKEDPEFFTNSEQVKI